MTIAVLSEAVFSEQRPNVSFGRLVKKVERLRFVETSGGVAGGPPGII